VPLGDLLHAPDAGLAERGDRADRPGVVGVEGDVEPGIARRLDEQRHVVAPVAGDDGVGARRLHLGDVGREVLHLAERVQVLADDLDVGALAREVGLGRARDRLPERVVLVDQVDLLDLLVLGEEGRERLHLHVAVGVEAEVPVAAFRVGEIRVDRGVVEVEDLLPRVALVVLLDRVAERERDRRALALDDVADAAVDDLLQLVQGLLRAHPVVEPDDLDLERSGEPLAVDLVGGELEVLEPVLAGVGERAGERVDVSHPDDLLRGSRQAGGEKRGDP
jgi:hypothetical protein